MPGEGKKTEIGGDTYGLIHIEASKKLRQVALAKQQKPITSTIDEAREDPANKWRCDSRFSAISEGTNEMTT